MLLAPLSEQLEYQIVVYPVSICLFVLAAIPLFTHVGDRNDMPLKRYRAGFVLLKDGSMQAWEIVD